MRVHWRAVVLKKALTEVVRMKSGASPVQFDGMYTDHNAEDRNESKGVAATGGGARMPVVSG